LGRKKKDVRFDEVGEKLLEKMHTEEDTKKLSELFGAYKKWLEIKQETIKAKDLQYYRDKEKREEKGKKGVYIIKKDGVVMYVGQTTDLDTRLKSHHYGFGADVSFIECNNTLERLDLETRLIKELKPLENDNTENKDVTFTTVKEVLTK